MISVGLLCRSIGTDNPSVFVEALDYLVGPAALKSNVKELQLSSLTCIAAIVEVCGPRTLAYLGKYMPSLLEIIQQHTVDKEFTGLFKPKLVAFVYSLQNFSLLFRC